VENLSLQISIFAIATALFDMNKDIAKNVNIFKRFIRKLSFKDKFLSSIFSIYEMWAKEKRI
jgi:hypothetical protein